MQSKAESVADYLSQLPDDRRAAIEAVRAVILENLDGDYVEGMQYGMIGYYVPHHVYPAGYHCDPKQPLTFVSLASQKNYMSLYLCFLYGDNRRAEWFQSEWMKTGKKLDMGKSCIRFKRVEDLALEVIGDMIRKVPVRTYIEHYEAALKGPKQSAKSAVEQNAKNSSAAKSKSSTPPASRKKASKKST